MQFWNETLRICPKCKAAVPAPTEGKSACPKCQTQVWFFHYGPLPAPPTIPQPRPDGLWANPTTTLLLGAAGWFGLVTLVAIFNSLAVAASCALAAIGIAAFGFVRHAETLRIEHGLEHEHDLLRYAETLKGRVAELTIRYNQLLKTGNDRVEHYYNEIYVRAAEERDQAATLRLSTVRRSELSNPGSSEELLTTKALSGIALPVPDW